MALPLTSFSVPISKTNAYGCVCGLVGGQVLQILLGGDALDSFEGALQDGAVGEAAALCYGIVAPVGMDGKPTRKGLYIHGGRKVAFRNYPFPSLFMFFYSFDCS